MVRNLCHAPGGLPANNVTRYDSYRRMLGLSPVLSWRVSQLLSDGPKWAASQEEIDKLTLPDNGNLPPDKHVEFTNEHLRHVLQSLRVILQSEPIVFVRDACFTNQLLRTLLIRIFEGEKNYREFVREVSIDYSNPPPDKILRDYLPGKRIVIIGGSESDTDSIHPDMYSNHIAKCVRESFSWPENSEFCHRFLTVCFWSQYAANLIGIECGDSLCVPATMRWAAQFWPSPCRVASLKNEHDLVRSFFSWLSFGREGGRVSLQFTRTGYVEPNFFSSKGESYLIPVVTDEVTWGLVWWADRRSHRIFGMQAHPEIPVNPNIDTLQLSVRSEVRRLLSLLKEGYGEDILSLEDQFFPEEPIRDPGIPFYGQALSTLADDLLYSIRKDAFAEFTSEYGMPQMDFDGVVNWYEWHLSLQSSSKGNDGVISMSLRQEEYLRSVDNAGRVELLCHADWKVGRGAESYGEVCWVDMEKLVLLQNEFRNNELKKEWFVSFNDFWAGNGTFLSEMRDRFEPEKSAFFYGVGDRIYFDLYQGLSATFSEVPDRIRMAFVQEVIRRYQQVSPTVEPTLRAKFQEVFRDFRIDPSVPIDFSSMFSTGTVMFSWEKKLPLEESEAEWVTNDPEGKIAEMASALSNNPYAFIKGSFNRISLADFRDYVPPEGALPKEDVRVSIRWTSHLDAGDLSTVLHRFVTDFAAPGGIFVDNGVHRSYTSVPRLREYLKLQAAYPNDVRVTMAYDPETNYFCSALVEKAPFHGGSFFFDILLPERFGNDGRALKSIIPVSIAEAEAHPFFRFERFFRDFIVSNFRSYEIFWFFNSDIVSFLGDAVHLLAHGHAQEIRKRFVELVGKICVQLNERSVEGKENGEPEILYVPITDHDLESWTSKEGDALESVLKTPYFPTDWFNPDGKRRY